MDDGDELPQTDEVKTILAQLEKFKSRRSDLQVELDEIDIKINELQDQLVKEKSRTSSVSDNIKIFEGLKDDRVNVPQRSNTQILQQHNHHRRSTSSTSQQPSSYVDLWICNSGDAEGGVKVPDSFVKPPPTDNDDATTASNYYSEPPPLDQVPQTPIKSKLNDSVESDPLAKFKDLMIPMKKDTMVVENEPIYANVCIDEYMKTVDEANISEDSEHELLDETDHNPINHHASARLVDHSTVRNLEEAKMYTQRNHIVQSFYESECVYHKYLKGT